MNYLAHLWLGSGGSDRFLAGNLAGDFIRGRIPGTLHDEIAAGVARHREIDAFTDSHPLVMQSRHRLVGEFRHHGRIIVDVFLDHVLASRWDLFSDEPLHAFARNTYARLSRVADEVPPRCAAVISRMRGGDWLTSYASVASIEDALFYLSRRLKRPIALAPAVRTLEREYDAFGEEMTTFLREIERRFSRGA